METLYAILEGLLIGLLFLLAFALGWKFCAWVVSFVETDDEDEEN